MSTSAPSSPLPLAPALRSRALVCAVAAYGLLLLAALVTANTWLDAAAALAFVTLLLSPGLLRRSAVAWSLWLLAGAGVGTLAARGYGRLALDLLPVLINAALCVLFARTLAPGRVALIAAIIDVIEGPERLALPRVAAYARGLTWAWTLLFGLQAGLLLVLIACQVPDGLLASFGVAPPFALAAAGWGMYVHLGSYAAVIGFLIVEYAFRRHHLGHIPHAPLAQFITQLARRWPALMRRFAAAD
ncbi:MAG: xanthomonadin biosynthesis protein [Dokdonella sp.]